MMVTNNIKAVNNICPEISIFLLPPAAQSWSSPTAVVAKCLLGIKIQGIQNVQKKSMS